MQTQRTCVKPGAFHARFTRSLYDAVYFPTRNVQDVPGTAARLRRSRGIAQYAPQPAKDPSCEPPCGRNKIAIMT